MGRWASSLAQLHRHRTGKPVSASRAIARIADTGSSCGSTHVRSSWFSFVVAAASATMDVYQETYIWYDMEDSMDE